MRHEWECNASATASDLRNDNERSEQSIKRKRKVKERIPSKWFTDRSILSLDFTFVSWCMAYSDYLQLQTNTTKVTSNTTKLTFWKHI